MLRLKDRFGLGPVGTGLAASAFGLAGMAAAPLVGRLLRTRAVAHRLRQQRDHDRGAAVRVLGTTLPVVVGGIVLVGAAVTGLRSATNALAVTSVPDNRGGAASLALSAQFFGGPPRPLWLPAYRALGDHGFALIAVVPLLSAGMLALTGAAGGRWAADPVRAEAVRSG
ncbi:hypothetical protein NKH77_01175 [Streptomyces sp. M19]